MVLRICNNITGGGHIDAPVCGWGASSDSDEIRLANGHVDCLGGGGIVGEECGGGVIVGETCGSGGIGGEWETQAAGGSSTLIRAASGHVGSVDGIGHIDFYGAGGGSNLGEPHARNCRVIESECANGHIGGMGDENCGNGGIIGETCGNGGIGGRGEETCADGHIGGMDDSCASGHVIGGNSSMKILFHAGTGILVGGDNAPDACCFFAA